VKGVQYVRKSWSKEYQSGWGGKRIVKQARQAEQHSEHEGYNYKSTKEAGTRPGEGKQPAEYKGRRFV
jgi:hypothetical protein